MTSIPKTTKQTNLSIILIAIIFIVFSCAHNGDWAKRIAWDGIEFANLPGENEYPDAGAIVIFDEAKMQIIGSNEFPVSMFERHRIIKILNDRGHNYANIAIPYTPKSWIENIQARTISPRGEIKALDKKYIYDVNLYPRFIFYSDQRAKIFTMPAIENGSVIEYRYQMRISGRSLWPSWNFQDFVPTLKSRFTLEAPSEWKVNYKLYHTHLEPEIDKAPSGFKSSYTWQEKDVPAFKSEFGMPSLNESLARLEIAPLGMSTWDDVALWYDGLSETQIKADKAIKDIALVLTKNSTSNEEKLRNIYEFVRDQVRYIAVAIGIGGYQPHPAEEVLLNRYGDCKDMATLLCSLAREVGIEAYEVLVSTWQNGVPDTSLPSPFQFNHAIAYCPAVSDSGVWLDATEKGCLFGELPWYDQNLPVLVIGKEGQAKIITTPCVPADSNHTLLDWHVDLQETGAAIVQGKTQYNGALASEMREAIIYASKDEQRQWLETFLASRSPGTKLDSFQISGLDPVKNPLIIRYQFHTNTFALPRTDAITICPGQIMAFDLPDYFRSANREHPIQLRFGVHNELKMTVNLPENSAISMPAMPDSIYSPFGSASWTYASKGNKIQVNLNCYLKGKKIDPEQYPEFQNFLDEIKARDLREVIITRNEK